MLATPSSPSPPQTSTPAPHPSRLIPLTRNEIPRLFTTLVSGPPTTPRTGCVGPTGGDATRHRAQTCHYRQQATQP